MKKITTVVAMALAIGIFTTVSPSLQVMAHAQSKAPKRIDWMKEGRSLVWEAKVPAKGVQNYVFKAHKGQKLSLSFIDDTGVGSMDLGKYSVEPNTDPMKMTIEVTKDYTLTLINNSKKTTSFRVGFELLDAKGVSIPAKTQSGREQVRFARGETSVALRRTLAADIGVGNITFIVNAQKGQTMNFSVEGAKGIEVSLSVPKAHDPEIVSDSGKQNTYKVVKTQTHYLTVVNRTGKVAPFTLKLQVLNASKPSGTERIKLPRGEQVADLKGTLAPKGSKKYVAYVIKGNLMTIVPQDEATKKVRVRLNGKEFNFQDSTATAHQTQSKDHTIEIYNPSNKSLPYHFNVGFSEHG